eukprot:TRINITY_DN3207_c0_g1_i3.p1 TRINITY_DN3207_c0_g1~~TRINITY_DN3207_c0_g1_i3.p1  ORF type:complete len:448 (+),score=216.22 TRINITY_DN3207_c0_g1_i3:285-1628(+)
MKNSMGESEESEEESFDGNKAVQVFSYEDGSYFAGQMEEGMPHGMGIMILPDHRYEGEWNRGMRHGHGCITYSDDSKFEGEWNEGERVGSGRFILQIDGEERQILIEDFVMEREKADLCELVLDLHMEKQELRMMMEKSKVENSIVNETNELLRIKMKKMEEERLKEEKRDSGDLSPSKEEIMKDFNNEYKQKYEDQSVRMIELEEKMVEIENEVKRKNEQTNKEWNIRLEKEKKKNAEYQKQLLQEQASRQELKNNVKEMRNLFQEEKKENAETSKLYSKSLIDHELLFQRHSILEKSFQEKTMELERISAQLKINKEIFDEERRKWAMELEEEKRSNAIQIHQIQSTLYFKDKSLDELSLDEIESAEGSLRKSLETLSIKKKEIFQNQLRKTEDLTMCKSCHRERASFLLLPCNHLAFCNLCEKTIKNCPICKKRIQKTISVSFT